MILTELYKRQVESVSDAEHVVIMCKRASSTSLLKLLCEEFRSTSELMQNVIVPREKRDQDIYQTKSEHYSYKSL